MKILLTGGAGYIGSHTCVQLLEAGYEVVVYDNFCNSHPGVMERVARITGREAVLVSGDVRDQHLLESVLREHCCDAVVHFAGLKAVGESTEKPRMYYENNVVGTLNLLSAMSNFGLKTLVFSSSATVYGTPQYLPLDEAHPLSASNPYGRSKLMVEDILRDLYQSDNEWKISILRYFNPVGAHQSGLIGEDPQGVPNNLMPFVAQVAVGRREFLNVWGSDYPTVDGTGVRDYIHVVDLANGHLKALQSLSHPQCSAINLGTGSGYSVLQLVEAFSRATSTPVPYRFAARRSGDVAACYANPGQAERALGWKARHGIERMCVDTWRWQQGNPNGYGG